MNTLKNYISYFDMYQIGVNLNFKQQEKHRSLFGGIVSIFTYMLVGFICWTYGKELIVKQNPIIIQSLREVIQSERIYIDKDNIIFMVGIQDQFSQSFVDPTVFQISAVIQTLEYEKDPITGQVIKRMVSQPRQISACDNSDVGVESLKDYFSQVNYPTFFCLKNNAENKNYIEGDFDQQSFSQMYIYINKCVNSTLPNSAICKSPSEIDDIMNLSKISFYLSDKLIVPSSFDEPIKDKAMNLFSPISTEFKKEIQLYYTNSYIQTDNGFFFQDLGLLHTFSYSEVSEIQYFDTSQSICRVLIRIRKIKEDYMTRKYQKIVDIAAQIGGLIKVITMIGAFLVIPFQRFHFHKMIVNEIFSFQTQEQVIENLIDQRKKSKQYSTKYFQNEQSSNKGDNNNNEQSSSKVDQPSDKTKKNRRGGYILTQVLKIFKVSQDAIKYNCFDYISHFFCPRIKSMEVKKPLLNYSIKKVFENLDILYILNKLSEIDKLKHILFDDDQLKLFEYIPKPKITIYDAQNNQDQSNNNNNNNNNKNNNIFSDKDHLKIIKQKSSTAPMFYFGADKTHIKKAEDAQKCLLQIFSKLKKTEVDLKLLNTVDPDLLKTSPSINNKVLMRFGSQQSQTSHFSQDLISLNQNKIGYPIKGGDTHSPGNHSIMKFFSVLNREGNYITNYSSNQIKDEQYEDKAIVSNQQGNEFNETGINLVKNNRVFFNNKFDFKNKNNNLNKADQNFLKISISQLLSNTS